MTEWRRVVMIGGVSIVAFDTVAATLSRLIGFPYGNASLGSWLIYFIVGFYAARATGSVGRAALAAAIVGAVEATLGWAVSWMIGPGRPPESTPDALMPFAVVVAVIMVVLTASVFGAFAGLVGRRRSARD